MAPKNTLSGIAFSVLFCKQLVEWPVFNFLSRVGQHSMIIFLSHVLVVAGCRIVLVKGFHITAWWIILPIGFIAGVVIPLVFEKFCRSNDCAWLFEMPRLALPFGKLGFKPVQIGLMSDRNSKAVL
jgi:hypothetical protein